MTISVRIITLFLALALLFEGGAIGLNLVMAQDANGEYDADGDRLIEISNLEQLNAVRYDLSDGNGQPDDSDDARAYRAAFPTPAGASVCDRACRGYELTSSLDFNSPDSYSAGAVDPEWNGGDGWLPINDNSSGLNAEFEGNGHTISNLYIHRQDTDRVGLFATVGGSGKILNAGVVNAEMEGRSYAGILAGSNSGTITDSYATGSVSGDNYVGGLVGDNSSEITASYAAGSVSGDTYVGGLVGDNSSGGAITASYATGSVSGGSSVGGLVGDNSSEITASYATGSVSGGSSVGGLVGDSSGGAITASYATGSVSGRDNYAGGLVGFNSSGITAGYATGSVSGDTYVGGLVGFNNSVGAITASYATGSVSGGSSVGGLAGFNNSGAITDSYWNTDIFGAGTDGEGRTTAQLQSPTGYTGIYRDWNADLDNADRNDDDATGADDFWDFGTSSQYPALKADIDGNGVATAAEFGGQRPTPPPPPGAPTAVAQGPTQIDLSWSAPSDHGGGPITAYDLRHIETGADANWTLVEDVWVTGSGTLQHSLTGLTGSTEYDVQVRAVNAVGESEWSATATGTTDPPVAPEAPTGLTARVVSGEAQVNLSWTAPTDTSGAPITGYKIESSPDGNTSWTEVHTTTGAGAVYTDLGDDGNGPIFGVGTMRYYRVAAINSVGPGAPSNVAKAEDLVARYDANNNDMIDKDEVIQAINDYLFGEGDEAISKAEVIELINLYLFG